MIAGVILVTRTKVPNHQSLHIYLCDEAPCIRWKYTYIVRLCTFSSYSYIIKLLILLFSYDLWLQRSVSRWKIQCHTMILFSPSIPLILWYPINCAHPQYRRTIVTLFTHCICVNFTSVCKQRLCCIILQTKYGSMNNAIHHSRLI